MKNIKIFLMIFIILFTYKINALTCNSSDLINRNICPKIELALANSDGSITSISCHDSYALAKEAMEKHDDNSTIILERKNDVTRIIDAKYALLYLDRGDTLTYLYTDSNLKKQLTYMDNYSGYGATDAAFITLNYDNMAVKTKIGGATGWLSNGTYKIIPINWVKTSSYYKITSDKIMHYYAKNIEVSNYSQSSRTIGPKPKLINEGEYKSYDGIYFYSNYFDMLDDYKANSYDKSINKDSPYYNYYLYLPHRTKTNYTIDDIDSYIRNVLNFNGSIYGKMLTNNKSVLYGSSEYFIYSEDFYGANALSVFSLSRNESANGRSSIAINKNNIFGHNAVDGAAYTSATGYLDVRSSIYTHGYGYINYGYAEIADSRYNGSHFGNKNTGMNVMYASDVYWGEKAASYYYSFDKDNGLLDYDYYQLIISNTSDINARSEPNTSSKKVFNIKKRDLPFVLIDEVEGESVKGNNIWYKIQADSNITNNGDIISSNSSWPKYNWNGYVYVHSSYFTKINDAKKDDGTYNSPKSINKELGTINTYDNKSAYTPKVGLLNNDTEYFYSSNLLEKKGIVKKNSYVVILEEIKKENETAYLIITDYSTVQKGWVSSKNIKLLEKDLLKVDIATKEVSIKVYDNPEGKAVSSIYNGSFLPIIDKTVVNNKLYLKVEYQIEKNILYGYVDSTIDNITYTTNHINYAPSINASDKVIYLNDSFNPMDEVTGIDTEDGDITSNIKIVSNNVNTKKEGNYVVTYSLKDSYGNEVSKNVNVQVLSYKIGDSLFMFNSFVHKENNLFIVSGFMGIKKMDNINVSNELIFVNEITKKEYTYKLNKWEDYPYEMSSLDDDKEYKYNDGWFKSTIDLSDLENGDYTIYIKCTNNGVTAKTLFTNIAYQEMTRRAKGNNKEYLIEVDYTTLNSPLLFSVRDNLISLDVPKTVDPMYNYFNEIKLNNNKLTIKGTSHNYGVSYSIKDNVERKIIFENQKDFTKYELDLGSITNGDYPITLAVSDNLDKTRAWFNKEIDLSSIPTGNYTIYIMNNVNGIKYYGELIDVMYTDFESINNDNYILSRNDNLRLRMELEVKK